MTKITYTWCQLRTYLLEPKIFSPSRRQTHIEFSTRSLRFPKRTAAVHDCRTNVIRISRGQHQFKQRLSVLPTMIRRCVDHSLNTPPIQLTEPRRLVKKAQDSLRNRPNRIPRILWIAICVRFQSTETLSEGDTFVAVPTSTSTTKTKLRVVYDDLIQGPSDRLIAAVRGDIFSCI